MSQSHRTRKSNPLAVCDSDPSLVTTLPWSFPLWMLHMPGLTVPSSEQAPAITFFLASTNAQFPQHLCILQHWTPTVYSFFQCPASGLGSCSVRWLLVNCHGQFPAAQATLQHALRCSTLLWIALRTPECRFVVSTRDRALSDLDHPFSRASWSSAWGAVGALS